MPRRAPAGIRPIAPDAVYGSKLVTQVINKVMVAGKKSLSERIVYDALEILSKRSGKEPVEALEVSIAALTPNLEVRSRRVGGATYQVPVEVPGPRARTLAVRWLVEFARARPEETMSGAVAGALARGVRAPPPGEDDVSAAGRRAARRPVAAGRRLQAQGRHLPHGPGKQ